MVDIPKTRINNLNVKKIGGVVEYYLVTKALQNLSHIRPTSYE